MRVITSRDPKAEYTEISFKVPKGSEAATNLPQLLGLLKYLGDVGSSRSVTVPEAFDLTGGQQDYKTGFDGDGNDRILDLTVDGAKYELPADFIPTESDPATEEETSAASDWPLLSMIAYMIPQYDAIRRMLDSIQVAVETQLQEKTGAEVEILVRPMKPGARVQPARLQIGGQLINNVMQLKKIAGDTKDIFGSNITQTNFDNMMLLLALELPDPSNGRWHPDASMKPWQKKLVKFFGVEPTL